MGKSKNTITTLEDVVNEKQQENENKEKQMSNGSTESKFSLNWKLLDNYGVEVMLTFRDNPETAEHALDVVDERSRFVEGLLDKGWKPLPGFGGGTTTQGSKVEENVDPDAPICNKHGVAKILKTGKKGIKPWAGYFCKVDKGCSVDWIDTRLDRDYAF